MADKIAVMNHGIIEQFGTPQEIYDRPASMYVADFIGSPPMNFLPASTAGLQRGRRSRHHRRRRRSRCRDQRSTCAGRSGARRPARAYPLRRRLEPARRGLRRGISRHDADRRGRNRAGPDQGAHRGRRRTSRPGETVGLSLQTASGCRSSTRRPAAPSRTALPTERAHG